MTPILSPALAKCTSRDYRYGQGAAERGRRTPLFSQANVAFTPNPAYG